jgi:D-alanine-D-alanine ligase
MRITILARAEPGADESFDNAVGQVAAGLRKGGHRISILSVQSHIGKLISGMKRRQPDLVFNLIGHPDDDCPLATTFMGLLDLLGLPYTGSGPAESLIQRDPSIIRALLGDQAGRSVSKDRNGAEPTNGFRGRMIHGARRRMDAGMDSRAFQVGVLGNEEPTAFLPIESRDSAMANACQASAEATTCLSKNLRADLELAAQAACRPLQVRDYAMMDVRLSREGQVRIAGVLPNCDLAQSGAYARSAAAAGIDFVQLVNRIADLAHQRAEHRQLTRLI